MPADEGLNEELRQAFGNEPGLGERRMMGGTCFFLNDHMIGGAHREKNGKGYYMFRVGKHNAMRAEAIGYGEQIEMGGRRMGGMYFVEADNCPDGKRAAWVALALDHARSLPPKEDK